MCSALGRHRGKVLSLGGRENDTCWGSFLGENCVCVYFNCSKLKISTGPFDFCSKLLSGSITCVGLHLAKLHNFTLGLLGCFLLLLFGVFVISVVMSTI